MSEQTPEPAANTAEADGFGAGDEPSMEDILASIRKIISDDADPVPLDGPVDVQDASTPEAVDVTETVTVETVRETTVEVETAAAPEAASALEDASVEAFDIDALMGDLDAMASEDELSIPEPEPQATEPDVLAAALSETVASETVTSENEAIAETDAAMDDMDRLMDEMLGDMGEAAAVTVEPEAVDGPVAASVAAEDDMDLVKSLMEDLTDDEIEPVSEVSTQPESVEPSEEPVEVPLDVLDAMEDDIFDSILEMTIEDEVVATDAVIEAETVEVELAEADVPSLADIAAAAEAEAETAPSAADAALLGGMTPEPATDPIAPTADVPTPTPPTQETPMPSALRSDAILDDVTEQATMGAFAQLNQVVEDKAVLSERGPRIGDLVQDALRPMLKEWLDENLQGIVERAVAKEVKRLSSGK